MDKNFDWDGFRRGKFVVHVNTQEECDKFIKLCKENGFEHINDELNLFKSYKEDTCFRGERYLTYVNYEFYAKNGYKIVEFADEFKQEKEPAPSANDTSSKNEKNLYTCYDTTDIERCQEYLKQIGIMLDSVVLADMGNATDLRNIGVMQVLIRLAIEELDKGN